jgi:hypothetical protein
VYALDAETGENYLDLSYPQGNSSSGFSFLVGTNGWDGKRDVASWDDVEGININVTGTVDQNYTVTFNGALGGAGDPVNEFEFWNFTYLMPQGSKEVPRVRLEFELE